MAVKEYTHVRKSGRLAFCYAGFEPIGNIRKMLSETGVKEKVQVEHFEKKGRTRKIHALYFLNPHQAIIGMVFPCGYCRNNSSLS